MLYGRITPHTGGDNFDLSTHPPDKFSIGLQRVQPAPLAELVVTGCCLSIAHSLTPGCRSLVVVSCPLLSRSVVDATLSLVSRQCIAAGVEPPIPRDLPHDRQSLAGVLKRTCDSQLQSLAGATGTTSLHHCGGYLHSPRHVAGSHGGNTTAVTRPNGCDRYASTRG